MQVRYIPVSYTYRIYDPTWNKIIFSWNEEFDECSYTSDGRSWTSEGIYTLDCLLDTRPGPQMEDIMHMEVASLAIYFLALCDKGMYMWLFFFLIWNNMHWWEKQSNLQIKIVLWHKIHMLRKLYLNEDSSLLIKEKPEFFISEYMQVSLILCAYHAILYNLVHASNSFSDCQFLLDEKNWNSNASPWNNSCINYWTFSQGNLLPLICLYYKVTYQENIARQWMPKCMRWIGVTRRRQCKSCHINLLTTFKMQKPDILIP